MVRSRLLSRVDSRDRNAAFYFAILTYALFSVLDVMTTVAALGDGPRERNRSELRYTTPMARLDCGRPRVSS